MVTEDHSDIANQVLTISDELHAPRLMASEIANAVSRKVRLEEIGRDLATILVASVSNLPVLWHRDEELCGTHIVSQWNSTHQFTTVYTSLSDIGSAPMC